MQEEDHRQKNNSRRHNLISVLKGNRVYQNIQLPDYSSATVLSQVICASSCLPQVGNFDTRVNKSKKCCIFHNLLLNPICKIPCLMQNVESTIYNHLRSLSV